MSDENQHVIEKAIQSELVHYEPMNHGEPLLNKVWDLNHIIQQNRVIEFNYFNAMNKGVHMSSNQCILHFLNCTFI